MRVDEMITAVREQALEFDDAPISDDGILRRLNFAYNYAYNHFVKSNDSMFAKWMYFDIKPAISSYDLPKDLYGKRVESLECPTPPQTGYQPFNYLPIERVDPQTFTKYDAPRARTLLPLVWTQMGGKLWMAPPPIVASRARILGTPALIPLGLLEGSVMDIQGDTLTLDKAPTSLLSNYLNSPGQNIVSICDGSTGELKAVYAYEGVNGVTIQLGSATTRTTVKGKEVRKCYTHSAFKLTWDAVNKTITATVNSTITGVSVGDYIEVQLSAVAGTSYNISDTLEDDSDFYDPPEYTLPALEFTRGGKVTYVDTHTITWEDSTAIPEFIDGYYKVPGAAASGTVTAAANSTYLGRPVVQVQFGADHGLELGRLYKLDINGTSTNLDSGTLKVIPDGTDTCIVLKASLTGTFVAGTWSLVQYNSSYVTTGWPALTDVSPSNPPIANLSLYVNSPYIYTLKDYPSQNNPEAYDHVNDIAIDDVVCWGYATAVPIIPEAYHEALVQYAVLTLKSSLNETDNEVAAILKELFTSMKGDTAGRRLGVRVTKDFGTRSGYLTQSRRLGRR